MFFFAKSVLIHGLRKKDRTCPLCKERFKAAPRVNRIIRQLLNVLEFNCEYCPVSFKFEDQKKHEKECSGLNFVCPNEGCEKKTYMNTREALAQHIRNDCD